MPTLKLDLTTKSGSTPMKMHLLNRRSKKYQSKRAKVISRFRIEQEQFHHSLIYRSLNNKSQSQGSRQETLRKSNPICSQSRSTIWKIQKELNPTWINLSKAILQLPKKQITISAFQKKLEPANRIN
jgi:hypothetical protein